ncbi:hypothetical protein HGRIS_011154 [Hohenbuehelia grisea]|uniref:F-box domain-containing protein n=1 Tax=Hohenbuehelia grisea TaxID=104357 RepID=A0ABR3IZE2_9AGAR
MTSFSFLELPIELIIRILVLCEFPAVLACQSTNRFLADVIKNSIELQYRRDAHIACADSDADGDGRAISERLIALRSRERAWRTFKYDFRERIQVPHVPSGIYDLTGGVLLFGDSTIDPHTVTTGLRYVLLPTAMFQPTEWAKISMPPGRLIIDVGVCVYEHDLLAIVTSTPDLDGTTYSVDVTLVHVSSRAPHIEAQQPTFHVCKLARRAGRLAIAIEIVGDHLALAISFPFTSAAVALQLDVFDRFYVFEWRTGAMKLNHRAPTHSVYCGLTFLATDTILLPNIGDATLEIWKISPEKQIHKIVGLSLPPCTPHAGIRSMTCRSEPNPCTRRAPTSPFLPSVFYDPVNALVTFNVYAEAQGDPFLHKFLFVTHRIALLKLVTPYSDGQDPESFVTEEPPNLPWDQWGPQLTRWFAADDISTRWITVAAGQRCAMIAQNARRDPSPLLIMDFNPYHIRSHQTPMPTPDDVAVDDEGLRHFDSTAGLGNQASGNAFFGPQDVVTGEIILGNQNIDGEDDEDDDDDDDEEGEEDGDDEDHSGANHADIDASQEPLDVWSITHEEELDPQGIFLEPVRSALPYLLYASPESYRYDGVLLDEERILGVKTDHHHRMTIDVFHFGSTGETQI